MSLVTVLGVSGGGSAPAAPSKYLVTAGAAASVASYGVPVKLGSTAGSYIPCANGDTSGIEFLGVSTGPSTETASVNGTVEVVRAPVLRCKMKATTPSNLGATVIGTLCTLDVSSGSYTVDENDTTNGWIKIVSYDNTTDGNCIVEIPCDQA